jgi:hypothetical protein
MKTSGAARNYPILTFGVPCSRLAIDAYSPVSAVLSGCGCGHVFEAFSFLSLPSDTFQNVFSHPMQQTRFFEIVLICLVISIGYEHGKLVVASLC